MQSVSALGIRNTEDSIMRVFSLLRRFVAFCRRWLTRSGVPGTDYGRAYAAFSDTMRRANTWDGRRLRVRLLADFGALGMNGTAVDTINPSATFLRIYRPANPRRALVLHFVAPEYADRIAPGVCGWTSLVDDFNADRWSTSVQFGADDVADELAAFLVAA